MRKFLPLIFLFLVATATYGQNKTLGVGTPAPNANAAMHVESPTNNQGFIMPRLTTAQRTGISSLLTATDNGLMLYDTDLKTIYIWDGAIWKSTAQVAGGSKLSYPYKDSVTTNPGAIDVFALKYNATDNARVMRIENQSATNGSSALSVYNQGVGLAGYFQVNNAASGASALYGTTNSDLGGALAPVGVYGQSTGTGSLGGSFRVSNAANTFPALYAETNGTGNVLNLNQINVGNTSAVVNIANAGTGNAIQTTGKIAAGQFIGNGSGLTNVTATNPRLTLPYQDSVLTAPANSNLLKLYYGGTAAANVGLAYFENLNPNNSFGPLFVRTLGIGSASNFFVTNTASAGAAVGGTTNGTGQAIRGLTTGTGQAGTFTVNNASNTSAALVATTNGSGSAIFSQNTGVGNGFAGNFTSTQATNTFPAIQANTAGTGPGVRVLQNASSLGGGMDVIMQNTSGTAVGFNVDQQGLGSAGSFGINNATNSSTALSAVTNGTGYALEVQATGTGDNALFNVSNPASSGSPVVATTNGIGLAGFFQVNNTTAGTTALQATTNSNVGGATPPVAIFGSATGTGASAGSFRINNATNPYAALFSQTNGTGMSLLVNHAGPSG
ncbi:MAG: hypothetical protein JJE09_14025, partial [Bacteroidia bacterium]|nr:hypothetical protein [Bacteroidia bacterium]